MKNFSRRTFIGKSGKGLTASMALSGLSFPAFIRNMGLVIEQPFGFQTWPIREMLVKDFPGVLKIDGIRRLSTNGNVFSGRLCRFGIRSADKNKTG